MDIIQCHEVSLKAKHERFAMQDPLELEMALRSVQEFNPKVIVEVGVAFCGSLASWAEVTTPDLVVGIDPFEIAQTDEQKASIAKLTEEFKLNLIPHRSYTDEAHQKLEELLAGRKIDFLFIDANHGYVDVRNDWNGYKQYLNDTALVGFHDIYYSDVLWDAGSQVSFFWDKIKQQYKFNHFYNHSTMGIGMIYV